MQILSDILFLASVLLTAFCMAGIAQGIRDDAEERRLKRREKYRRIAYAEVYRRRIKSSNRDALWKAVNK